MCTRGVLLKKPWRHGFTADPLSFTADPLSFTAFKGGKRSLHGLLTSEPQSSPRRVHKIQVVCTRSVHVFRVGCSMAMVLRYVHDAYTQAPFTGRTVYWDRAKPSSRGHCIGPWSSNEGHPRSSVHCAYSKSAVRVRAVYIAPLAKALCPLCKEGKCSLQGRQCTLCVQ